jgi:TPR repeat protein
MKPVLITLLLFAAPLHAEAPRWALEACGSRLLADEELRDPDLKAACAELAPSGDVEARLNLGSMHLAAGDSAAAFTLFRGVAREGDGRGQALIARAYMRGAPGLPRDLLESCVWWLAAKERGYAFYKSAVEDIIWPALKPAQRKDCQRRAKHPEYRTPDAP